MSKAGSGGRRKRRNEKESKEGWEVHHVGGQKGTWRCSTVLQESMKKWARL